MYEIETTMEGTWNHFGEAVIITFLCEDCKTSVVNPDQIKICRNREIPQWLQGLQNNAEALKDTKGDKEA